MKFSQWFENEYFQQGTFSWNDKKEYSVANVIKHLEKIHYPIARIHVRKLIQQQFNGFTHGDEPVGSPEWQDRANKTENYPILVMRNPDGILWVADGNHRLWKAYRNKQKYIKSYVVNNKLLENLPQLLFRHDQDQSS